MTKTHFKILEGYPPDVIAVEATGHITGEDYENKLIPLVNERIKAEGKVNLLYVIGPDFKGFSGAAMWDDAKLGLLHFSDFAHIAVVTDVEWIRLGVRMFAPLMPAKVKLFDVAELDAAKAWISEGKPEAPHKPGVDATHKLPTLEDRQT